MEGFKDLQWYDFLRLLNAVLALIAMWRLGQMYRTKRRLEKFDRRRPESRVDDFFWVISAAMFAILVGMLEQISGDTEFRSASILSFMIVLVTLKATRRRTDPITHL